MTRWIDKARPSRRACARWPAARIKRATSFDKAAENLARTAQITLSGEQLRLVVEAEGRHVQAVQQAAALATAWTAADCVVRGKRPKSAGKNPRLHGLRRRDGADHHPSGERSSDARR